MERTLYSSNVGTSSCDRSATMCRGSVVLRVLVVCNNDSELVWLKEYYRVSFRPYYARSYGSEVILDALTVDRVKGLLNEKFNPHIVIISDGFPIRDAEEVKKLLRTAQVSATPCMVRTPD